MSFEPRICPILLLKLKHIQSLNTVCAHTKRNSKWLTWMTTIYLYIVNGMYYVCVVCWKWFLRNDVNCALMHVWIYGMLINCSQSAMWCVMWQSHRIYIEPVIMYISFFHICEGFFSLLLSHFSPNRILCRTFRSIIN